MNNAVATGLRHIKEHVSERILTTALAKHLEFGLDNAILDQIIVKSTIADCQLGGGNTVQINLEQNWAEALTDRAYSVYRIPAHKRSERDILEVHRVQYLSNHNTNYFVAQSSGQRASLNGANPFFQANTIKTAQNNMLQSKTGVGTKSSTPTARVIQGDMIELDPAPGAHIDWTITCRLAYDSAMTNLNSEAILRFSNLCVIKAKMLCYNKLIIDQDAGHIHFGAELTGIKDIVSRWSDIGDDTYQEALRLFFKGSSMGIKRIAPVIKFMV